MSAPSPSARGAARCAALGGSGEERQGRERPPCCVRGSGPRPAPRGSLTPRLLALHWHRSKARSTREMAHAIMHCDRCRLQVAATRRRPFIAGSDHATEDARAASLIPFSQQGGRDLQSGPAITLDRVCCWACRRQVAPPPRSAAPPALDLATSSGKSSSYVMASIAAARHRLIHHRVGASGGSVRSMP